MLAVICSLISVGFLWGATNPFIRLSSKGIKNIKEKSIIKKFFLEVKFLFTKPKYLLPVTLNQSGSLLYILTLQSANLSSAVPIANSLSFIFSAITGYYVGEKLPTKNIIKGSILVSIGSAIMIFDKVNYGTD